MTIEEFSKLLSAPAGSTLSKEGRGSGMFESIEFTNIRAFRNAVLPLRRLTVICGPEGSGKTTALQGACLILHGLIDEIRSHGTDKFRAVSIYGHWKEPGNEVVVRQSWGDN